MEPHYDKLYHRYEGEGKDKENEKAGAELGQAQCRS